MPDSTIFALGGAGGDAEPDSVCENSISTFAGGNSWATCVGSALSVSDSQNSGITADDFGVWNAKFFGRGTSNTWECNRSYFAFDLSGESETVASAELKVKCDNLGDTGTNSSTVHVVGATTLADSTSDYGNVFSSGTTAVGDYGSTTISTTLGFHTWTINSAGITAINNAIGSGIFNTALIGYYDKNTIDPTSNELKIKIFYANNFGTTNDPKLELTFAGADGFGHKTIGVAAASISKVKGVATANVGKVIGVD